MNINGNKKFFPICSVIISLLFLPVLIDAAAVPWNSQTYSVWVRAYTTGDIDSASGLYSASAFLDSYCCSGGWEYGSSYADGSLLDVTATSQGVYASSQAFAEFEGTYIAHDPFFLFSYDLIRNHSEGVIGNWGTILIQDETTLSTLFSWEGLFSDSDVLSIPTKIGNEIYVNFSIDAYAGSGVIGLPEVNSATLNYTMSVVPEPISSILFITGGGLLAGRRFIRGMK